MKHERQLRGLKIQSRGESELTVCPSDVATCALTCSPAEAVLKVYPTSALACPLPLVDSAVARPLLCVGKTPGAHPVVIASVLAAAAWNFFFSPVPPSGLKVIFLASMGHLPILGLKPAACRSPDPANFCAPTESTEVILIVTSEHLFFSCFLILSPQQTVTYRTRLPFQ